MTKKLLPAMIGAALVGGMSVASADVSVFGHIDEAVLNWHVKADYHSATTEGFTTSGSESLSDTNLRCTTCSLGFKGSEDLGNGLKAIFKLDFQYDINNRNKNITDRDQWLGLAGGFGQLRVGTISTVYKSHGAMIDPVYRTVVQARDVGLQSSLHSGAGEEGQGRATNTFRWDSPDFSGVKVGVTYTLDSTKADGETKNPYGIGVSYQNGGILGFVDYLTNDGSRSSGDYPVYPDGMNKLRAWKLGGKYAMDSFSVFGQYENIKNDNTTFTTDVAENLGMLSAVTGLDAEELSAALGASLSSETTYDNETNVWHVGGTYTMGSNTLYLAYGQSNAKLKNLGGSSDQAKDDRYELTLAGIHNFSKSTLVYGGYSRVHIDLKDSWAYGASKGTLKVDAFTVGMKKTF